MVVNKHIFTEQALDTARDIIKAIGWDTHEDEDNIYICTLNEKDVRMVNFIFNM